MAPKNKEEGFLSATDCPYIEICRQLIPIRKEGGLPPFVCKENCSRREYYRKNHIPLPFDHAKAR